MPFVTPLLAGYLVNVQCLTSGQFQIPQTAVAWSTQITSGTAWIADKGPFVINTLIESSSPLTAPINVGCTGGQVAITYFAKPPLQTPGP